MKKLPIFLVLALGVFPAYAQRYTVFPQFATGEGWSTDVFLGNQGSSSVSGIIVSFWASAGTPVSVTTNLGTGSNFNVSLSPGASQTIRVSSSGSLSVGYVVLRLPISAPVTATEVFRYKPGETVLAELGVPMQSPGTSFAFPAEVDSAREINTGVAFANPTYDSGNAQAQTFIVNLIRADGTLQQTARVAVKAGEHKPVFLNEPTLFGAGLDNFSGLISVSGATRFGVLALRQDKGAYGTVSTESGPVLGPFKVTSNAVPESETNNTTSTAQAVSGNMLISGTISTPGDIDYFKFSGAKDDLVTMFVDTQGLNSNLDSVLRLEKADGTIVCQNDQNGLYASNDSFLQTILPESGTYYVRVTDYYNDGSASHTYRLHLNLPGNTPPPPTNVPAISVLNPSSGNQGTSTQITIQGTNLSGTTAVNFSPSTGISLGGLQSSATQVSASLSIASDAPTGTHSVSVTTAAGTSNTLSFTVNQAPPANQPVINVLTPSNANQGVSTQITIQGTNLAGATAVNFTPSTGISVGSIQASATQVSAVITIATDSLVGTRNVSVTTAAGTSNTLSFTVNQGSGGSDYNGNWTGTTSQSKPVSFTVTGGVITKIKVAGSFSGYGCTADSETETTGSLKVLSSNTFSFTNNGGPGGITFTISGTFSSSTQVSGSLNMTLNSIPGVPSCSGSASVTWSAAKN